MVAKASSSYPYCTGFPDGGQPRTPKNIKVCDGIRAGVNGNVWVGSARHDPAARDLRLGGTKRNRLVHDRQPAALTRCTLETRGAYIAYNRTVTISLDLPEDIAMQLSQDSRDLTRLALESVALEAYRAHKLSTEQMRRLLGFETRDELDGFLKAHEVWLDYTAADLERDRESHRRLGL